jgi:hypothetical protein
MAELHIDDDWKKQAQEEKKRLAEEAEKRKAAAAPAGPAGVIPTQAASPSARPSSGGRSGGRSGREEREMPQASFGTLVQSMVTQILLYIGDLAVRGSEGMVNLDVAKHNLDTLTLLEEKTQGNLSAEEKEMLDNALYETRMRYISVASRHAELP